MSELNELMKAYVNAGGKDEALADAETAHLAASGHSILSSRAVAGITMEATESPTGISGRIVVREGVKVQKPIHLCFGVLHAHGLQEIKMDVTLERNSSASFVAHCFFPNAEQVTHIMDATVTIGDGASMQYAETHFHGPYGGVEVLPRLRVSVGARGRYVTDFTLTTGRVGKLGIDYIVDAGEDAVVELTARVFGHANDEIAIQETVLLNGRNARGMIKARVALEDDARAEIRGATEGNAEGCRGHVDCMEIVKDRAVASAIPLVRVTHPLAKVTHEAAIGSVDKRQMETLMAHGLSPEEAVDVIVKGVLR